MGFSISVLVCGSGLGSGLGFPFVLPVGVSRFRFLYGSGASSGGAHPGFVHGNVEGGVSPPVNMRDRVYSLRCPRFRFLYLEISSSVWDFCPGGSGIWLAMLLFESSHKLIPPPSLKGFMPANEIMSGDFVFMNSAFTGYVEGTANVNASTRVRRIPSGDQPKPENEWIETRWDYMGQGSSHKYVDGACRSVIWNEDECLVAQIYMGNYVLSRQQPCSSIK